jgi:SAM-dependent methyltransferase
MKLLNIGCGTTFHPSWTNLDIASMSSDVLKCDIRKRLPFQDNHFDVCYTSHVLEHLTFPEANYLIQECFRIVPDLEGIVRKYLEVLERVKAGVLEAVYDYDWMMLELYDQAVRSSSGGYMYAYLQNPNLQNKAFVRSRIGLEAEQFWNHVSTKNGTIGHKLKARRVAQNLEKVREKIISIFIRILAGKDLQQAYEEGVFRSKGEIHRWMYDSYSLQRLLENSKFSPVYLCDPHESRISDFNSYELDVVNQQVRKPDSLFVEGVKP